jgi:hypothetical protein
VRELPGSGPPAAAEPDPVTSTLVETNGSPGQVKMGPSAGLVIVAVGGS